MQVNSAKYRRTEALFSNIWTSLVERADTDNDGKISVTEWITLWESYKMELVRREKNFLGRFYQAKNPNFRQLKEGGAKLGDVGEWDEVEKCWKPRNQIPVPEDTILPGWLHDYLTYRFDLLDRTGDGEIDTEEYEYVLCEFGIKEKDSKRAFDIFSQHGSLKVDFDYFIHLFEEYYLSDDPADLGNFVNGKLEFPLMEEEEVEVQEQPLSFEEQIEKNRDDQMEDWALANEEKECKPKKSRKKTIKKMKHWFEKKVLLIPPET